MRLFFGKRVGIEFKMIFLNYLSEIYKILGFLPLAIVIYKYLRGFKLNKSIKNFLPFIILMFVATIVECRVFNYNVKKWIWFYDFFEFFTLLFFFYRELKYKKTYSFFSIYYLILFVYLCSIWKRGNIDDQPLVFSTVILVLASTVLWFVNVFKNFEETPLYKRTNFYFVGVILFYILSTSLSFMAIDYFMEYDRDSTYILKRINYIFNIISRLVISIIIIKSSYKRI